MIITVVIINVIIIIIYGDLKFFLDVSDWLVHQLAYNNLSLAVQLEIQTPKEGNRKLKKQNKWKISKFYFQLLTHTKKKS